MMAAEPDAIPALEERSFVKRGLLVFVLLGCSIFIYGFLAFVFHVNDMESEVGQHADGVVALTGGAERIADALSVLAEGRAKRLLITGVHPHTSASDLVRQSGHPVLFQCCVDVDRQALNTVGNALETAKWVEKHGYRSLFVVTSSYHMPRAVLELKRRMPGIELIAHPVVTEGFRADRWWHDHTSVRLLISEYVKLLAAQARIWFFPKGT